KNRKVYFLAGGREKDEDPYQTHLYCVGFDGKGLTLLSPENASHSASVSPDPIYPALPFFAAPRTAPKCASSSRAMPPSCLSPDGNILSLSVAKAPMVRTIFTDSSGGRRITTPQKNIPSSNKSIPARRTFSLPRPLVAPFFVAVCRPWRNSAPSLS